jgi:hypothetical protein
MKHSELDVPPFASELPPLAERRFRRRRQVFTSAILASLDGSQHLTCQICNLSARGAKIKVPTFQPFPTAGFLIFWTSPLACQTKIVWTSPHSAGLTFGQRIVLNRPLDPKFDFLKELWLSRSLR